MSKIEIIEDLEKIIQAIEKLPDDAAALGASVSCNPRDSFILLSPFGWVPEGKIVGIEGFKLKYGSYLAGTKVAWLKNAESKEEVKAAIKFWEATGIDEKI